jgi:hypothetical protein
VCLKIWFGEIKNLATIEGRMKALGIFVGKSLRKYPIQNFGGEESK